MGNADETALTPTEIRTFQRLADIMIPADTAYGVPAASDPVIFADIVKSLDRDLAAVRSALALLNLARFAELDDERAEAFATDFLAEPSADIAALGRCILQCYYRDDRVLIAIGREPRPPFPKGNVIEQGDWSLLEPVKARTPFWRDDRGA